MNAYKTLARYYDRLTRDVPYDVIADYVEAHFSRLDKPVRSIVDLACGTGTLACLLADRGYDMIGVDASSDMLAVAADKSAALKNRPLYIQQPLEELDLYGTSDAVICTMDGMNYLKPAAIQGFLQRVRLFLEPGGLFLFDLHDPAALRARDGAVSLDETDDIYCVWRTSYDATHDMVTYGMDIFTHEGCGWSRASEEHFEYVHEPDDVVKLLGDTGFDDIAVWGDRTFESPSDADARVFISARKPQ